jgi:hypothetical protein
MVRQSWLEWLGTVNLLHDVALTALYGYKSLELI